MLVRVKKIHGVGLLERAGLPSVRLHACTLVYAPNGYGKSTIASVFRSLTSGDGTVLEERRTIDSNLEPMVQLQLTAGEVKFESGRWEGPRPAVCVYDTHFIETNVYSGESVTTEHRRNLLGFALGSSAVDAKAAEAEATEMAKERRAALHDLQLQLEKYQGEFSRSDFRRMRVNPQVDGLIESLRQQLEAAQRADAVLSRPLLEAARVPPFELEHLFVVLQLNLSQVHAQAEHAVQQHAAHLGGAVATEWLREGHRYEEDDRCPYCDQSLTGVELVQMYRSYFDEAFARLVEALREGTRTVETSFSDAVVESFRHEVAVAAERRERWRADVEVPELGEPEFDVLADSIRAVRNELLRLLRSKQQDPTRAVTESELISIRRRVDQLRAPYDEHNERVRGITAATSRYLDGLRTIDPSVLARDLARAQAVQRRYSPAVVDLIERIEDVESELEEATTAMRAARRRLSDIMGETLAKYRDAINHHLSRLGAQFAIEPFSTNYMGQAPRVDYKLALRGRSVTLSGAPRNFANALSEGDKRCLAFSFFATSVLRDEQLADKIVVIDDPVSSLDRSRRAYTIEVIEQIAARAKQLIVLGHDAVFLRDLRKGLARSSGTEGPVVELQLVREGNRYSNLTEADLDRECESEYFQNYRVLQAYVDGGTGNPADVARSIRLLIEGHLHRRFPGQVPDGMMLGQAIAIVEGAVRPSPLVHASSQVEEFRALNRFVGGFHHDTEPDRPTVRPDDSEVLAFARRALDLVHGA
ncbi:AAA family ATPase [Curtobacterium flaccumfaciens]|uniref:AAA family ATPase n=1 Tax=Curtobacterium flaccumfaciens TaxID=2035 RepID=UPI00136798D4|nr:AAA family ATPase [Curtobacterium flaccumfaciens]MBT1664234.1 AAA family ATPase [Curtobacterium flaccumfaciens pv. flaccumfaciens]QHN62656.1 AAA family ATPase [Curtobacterium flaccumfaciens pv. flaccumfaciens]